MGIELDSTVDCPTLNGTAYHSQREQSDLVLVSTMQRWCLCCCIACWPHLIVKIYHHEKARVIDHSDRWKFSVLIKKLIIQSIMLSQNNPIFAWNWWQRLDTTVISLPSFISGGIPPSDSVYHLDEFICLRKSAAKEPQKSLFITFSVTIITILNTWLLKSTSESADDEEIRRIVGK